jgi:hypothetical protein
MRFQSPTTARMNCSVFWYVAPCGLAEVYASVTEMLTASIIRAVALLSDYKAQRPKRQSSSK